MRIAMLSSIAWRTPPKHYGPWESIVSSITEELVARGHDVTLFATGDSITSGKLHSVCDRGYEEDRSFIPKVMECLHISELFEQAHKFDIIHNNFDFLPLSYSKLVSTPIVTTIHGFSSPKILPIYKKYNNKGYYVSISDSDRSSELTYIKTIHHGLDLKLFDFEKTPDDYLLFFGRFHHDKGPDEAIKIAKACNIKLIMAGIIQDENYFNEKVKNHIDDSQIIYVGSVGPKERNKLLGKACALIHPINFEEPFGLSVIESMACGTPVIAYNKGSMGEIIIDGENGFLVNNAKEAIDAVFKINDIDRIKCRQHVEDNFTISRMVDEYIEVYQQIMQKTKASL